MTPKVLMRRREALGLNQSEVAELAGLTGKHRRMTVYAYESGKRNMSAAVATLLDIRLGELEAMEPADLAAFRDRLRQKSGRRVWTHQPKAAT